MSVIGAVLGYNLWRRRSAHPVVQLVLSLGLPALLTVLALGAGHSSGELTIVATSLLASTALGESLGAISERYSGAHNPKRLRAAWEGITSLGDAHGSRRITFDIRPLFRPVSKKEAKSALKATPQYGAQPNFGALKTLFLIMFPILVVVTITAFTDEDYVTGPDAPSQISGMAAVFSLMYVGYAIIGFLGIRGWQHMTSVADHLRLSEFAEVNGFSYDPGPVLNETQTSKYSRVMWREDGWLLANALKLGEADPHSVAPVTQFSGVSEFKLPVALPHILLLRRGLRMPTFSTTTSPKREQRLQLEGDFNTYFTVFCPTGYERDALYLLTPDVMGALIDGARTFDIEIVDDRLILRTRRDLVTTDPGVWLSLARAVSALSGRSEQWARWRDDRREPLGTASPRLLTERPTGAALAGRRLRGGLGLSGILIATYIGIYLGLTGLSNLL
ncbi:MAG: hypothetical protein ACTIJ6_00945 [Leucobacter sp.]